jgi:hypothetical protein
MLGISCAVNFYNAGVVTHGRRIDSRVARWVCGKIARILTQPFFVKIKASILGKLVAQKYGLIL